MSKNRQYQIEEPKEKEEKVHPIWRGIGCVSIVFIPLISYAASVQLLTNKDNFPWLIIPQELIYNTGKDPLIFVKIIFTIVIAALLFFIMAIITFLVNKFAIKTRK